MTKKITSTVTYLGSLRTESVHQQSGNRVITDAPTDNHGKGEAFSPTDLVATSLASCMMTILGIKTESMGMSCQMRADVTKVMSENPRMISEIIIDFYLKGEFDEQSSKILEAAAHTCPVGKSLHPEIKQTIHFFYNS